MSFGVWCFSAPGWSPASTAVMVMKLFPFGWISVLSRGSRHQVSPSSLPDLPQAFARIPTLQGQATILHTAQCLHPTPPCPSWVFLCPRGLLCLRGEPMGTSFPPFSLAHPVSIHFLFFFPFAFCLALGAELSKAPPETSVTHPHSHWLGGQRG